MMRRILSSLAWSRTWRRVRALLGDRRGVSAVVLAVAAVPIVGSIGLAVDTSLAFVVRSQLTKALDAAGLAAGRVAFTDHAESDAREFMNANFPSGFMGATLTQFDVAFDERREFITLTATAQIPTTFTAVLGIEKFTIAGRTVIHRQNRGMELALVMDNTGSMRSGGKMDAMKGAAHELMGIIYGDKTALDDVWISLVPYTATVNIGDWRTDWLDAGDRVFDAADPFAPTAWKGCVEARAAPYDGNDTPPGVEPFDSYFYAAAVDNVWPPVDADNDAQNDGTGPNLGCGPAITPLTQSRAQVESGIDEMLPWHRGGTTGNLGLSWGWRTISPAWRGQWGGSTPGTMPLDYGAPLMDKVVIMLTDGQNQFYDWPDDGPGPGGSDYTAYGRLNDFGFATLNAGRVELDARMAATCSMMKQNGIVIYAITFGPTPDSTTQALYRACASKPTQYFHSPTNEMLVAAFRTIGTELSNLRIAQ